MSPTDHQADAPEPRPGRRALPVNLANVCFIAASAITFAAWLLWPAASPRSLFIALGSIEFPNVRETILSRASASSIAIVLSGLFWLLLASTCAIARSKRARKPVSGPVGLAAISSGIAIPLCLIAIGFIAPTRFSTGGRIALAGIELLILSALVLRLPSEDRETRDGNVALGGILGLVGVALGVVGVSSDVTRIAAYPELSARMEAKYGAELRRMDFLYLNREPELGWGPFGGRVSSKTQGLDWSATTNSAVCPSKDDEDEHGFFMGVSYGVLAINADGFDERMYSRKEAESVIERCVDDAVAIIRKQYAAELDKRARAATWRAP